MLLVTSQRAASSHRCVVPRPYAYDGNEGDGHEDDVETEEEAINDDADHLPVLRLFAAAEVIVDLEANGPEVSAQVPQFIQHQLFTDHLLWSRVTQDVLKSIAGDDAGRWFCHGCKGKKEPKQDPQHIQVLVAVGFELKASLQQFQIQTVSASVLLKNRNSLLMG